MKNTIIFAMLLLCGAISAQKGVISLTTVPITGQVPQWDGTNWVSATIAGSSGDEWLKTGNTLTATGNIGSNTNSGFGFNFLGNNVIRGGMTAFGNFSFGQQGGTLGRATFATSGPESAQIVLRSGVGTNSDSIQLGAININPNGSYTFHTGSMLFDGVSGIPYVNQSGGGTGTTWRKVQTGNDTTYVSMQILQSNYTGASGTDDLAYFTIPSWMQGYELIDYQVSGFTNTQTTGTTLFRLQDDATNLTGVSFTSGTTEAETGGFNNSLVAGHTLTLDTGADTGTPDGTVTGLSVILKIIEK